MSVIWHGDSIKKSVRKGIINGIFKSAVKIQGESIQEAPLKEGDLKGNCAIDDRKLETHLEAEVGYNLPYARKQHEELDFNHPLGGKAKFLEDPFNRNIDDVPKNIANEIKKVIK